MQHHPTEMPLQLIIPFPFTAISELFGSVVCLLILCLSRGNAMLVRALIHFRHSLLMSSLRCFFFQAHVKSRVECCLHMQPQLYFGLPNTVQSLFLNYPAVLPPSLPASFSASFMTPFHIPSTPDSVPHFSRGVKQHRSEECSTKIARLGSTNAQSGQQHVACLYLIMQLVMITVLFSLVFLFSGVKY